MLDGVWGQQMVLSDRDLCQGLERAVLAADIRFTVLNLSLTTRYALGIDETRRCWVHPSGWPPGCRPRGTQIRNQRGLAGKLSDNGR